MHRIKAAFLVISKWKLRIGFHIQVSFPSEDYQGYQNGE